MAVAPFLFFPLIGTGNPWLMLIGFLVLFSGFAANYGALNAFLPHQFPARLRYSPAWPSASMSAASSVARWRRSSRPQLRQVPQLGPRSRSTCWR